MKKVIDGSLYNTETATRLGVWDNGIFSNIGSVDEALYVTRAGKYFLHGFGGSNTKYAEQTSNNHWSSGEAIIPLSAEAARKWAEERMDGDSYVKAFGEPEEGDDLEPLNLTVPAAIKHKLKLMREESGKSISQIVTDIISEHA